MVETFSSFFLQFWSCKSTNFFLIGKKKVAPACVICQYVVDIHDSVAINYLFFHQFKKKPYFCIRN